MRINKKFLMCPRYPNKRRLVFYIDSASELDSPTDLVGNEVNHWHCQCHLNQHNY